MLEVASTINMAWPEETKRSTIREENKLPEYIFPIGPQFREIQDGLYITFFEMFGLGG